MWQCAFSLEACILACIWEPRASRAREAPERRSSGMPAALAARGRRSRGVRAVLGRPLAKSEERNPAHAQHTQPSCMSRPSELDADVLLRTAIVRQLHSVEDL